LNPLFVKKAEKGKKRREKRGLKTPNGKK